MFWQEVLEFAQTTTYKIGSQLVDNVGQLPAVRKDDGSLVTEADKWADAEIRSAIAATFPHHGVLTEETEHIFPAKDWCWIVDPIDGTTNFTRGIPVWGICLGLLYRGVPVFGHVYLPNIQQSFHGYYAGESGLDMPTGAYLNDRPIHTSQDNPTNSHLFNICARSTKILQQPFPCKIRMIGVASYGALLVASGTSLGGVEATPKVWDLAATIPILQAAGGVLVSLNKKPIFPLQVGQNYGQRSFPSLFASRPELVSLFLPLVSAIARPHN